VNGRPGLAHGGPGDYLAVMSFRSWPCGRSGFARASAGTRRTATRRATGPVTVPRTKDCTARPAFAGLAPRISPSDDAPSGHGLPAAKHRGGRPSAASFVGRRELRHHIHPPVVFHDPGHTRLRSGTGGSFFGERVLTVSQQFVFYHESWGTTGQWIRND